MIFKRNGSPVMTYNSEYYNKKIVIGIDSSKSNSGIVIGDPNGNVYNDYEIDGSGSENNVYIVASETRKAMRELLKGSEILGVGLEDIITKRDKDHFNSGLDVHKSRAAITHIFDSFIMLFMDYFGIFPDLINNGTWKKAIIPPEFNRKGEKGAKLYYDTCFPNSRWAGRKDDVTDAYGIYQYEILKKKFSVNYTITAPKIYTGNMDWGLYPVDVLSSLDSGTRRFEFNKTLTIEQHVNTIAAEMSVNEEMAYCKVPIEYIPLELIYSKRIMEPFPKKVKEIILVVAK